MTKIVTLINGDQVALNPIEVDFDHYNPMVSASGLLRTTGIVEHFSQKSGYDEMFPFWITTNNVGGGIISYNAQACARVMTINNSVTSDLDTQTAQAFVYLAGSGMYCTLAIDHDLSAGSTVDIGIYDNSDGLFFRITRQLNNQYAISVVHRNSASGVSIDTVISQANWNLDKMNGTGASGVTLDLTKVQMLYLQWNWYGGGTLNWGFEVNRRIIIVHSICAANNLNTFILGNPDLPLRCRLYNNGAQTGFSTVALGGIFVGGDGVTERRKGFNRGVSIATRSISTNNTWCVLAIRPATTFKGKVNRAYCKIEDFVCYGTADGRYDLMLNPTIPGGTWIDVNTGASMMQMNATATTLSGGTILYSGGFSGAAELTRKDTTENASILTAWSNGAGTNTLALVFSATNNGTIGVSFNWLEIY